MWISCGNPVDNLVDKQVFRMNLDEGLNTLDPAYARSRAPIWMTAQLFNGLISLDSTLHVQPSLARNWEIADSGREYRFFLRKNVFFHTHPAFGKDSTRAVTAGDFVYSFTRICDSRTASTGKWIFSGKIEGLEAFDAGDSPTISGFSAPDDSTFIIRLTRPFPPFPGLLAMPYGYVVPREVVEFYGENFRNHPVGTGPFRFFRWKEGNQLILHKNPLYFETEKGQRLPHLDAISVKFIPSRLSAFIEFVQGKLDFIGDLDNSYKDEVLNLDGTVKPAYREKYQVLLSPQLNTEYLGMQIDSTLELMKNHPLRDVRVRQALNYAIDRERLVKYLLNGMGYPGNSGFIPNGMPGFDPDKVSGYRFNPEKSRTLLAEAGYPGGRDLPEIVLYSTAKYAHISEFIQKSFEDIGVKLDIQNLQGGALRKEIYSTRIHFWRASWIADYPDGENYLSLFFSANFAPEGPNTTHFNFSDFDRQYRTAMTVTEDSARWGIYQRMENQMMAQSPVIVLYYDRSFRLLQPGITGLTGNPMNHLFLKSVRISN
ncbi:MAG: ABC transporter substrate-binding protein [Bacteroidia bacterium]|nr:ABC transporter substrate-binding protein [Bacteroidia bacterium]